MRQFIFSVYFCLMSLSVLSDDHFMKLAYQEAEKAFNMDEVPVGAIIVCEDQVIARAHNMTETLNDASVYGTYLGQSLYRRLILQKQPPPLFQYLLKALTC